MGTDIHLTVEAKIHNKDWRPLKRTLTVPNDLLEQSATTYDLGWGDGRNYNAFAMLANVRNGVGFAGTDMGDGFEPISIPRGFPEDSRNYTERDRSDNGHSSSWLSLRELLDLEGSGYWDKTTTHRGVFTRQELEQAKIDGIVKSIDGQHVELTRAPQSWAGSISGPDPKDIFKISWISTYRDSAGWLLDTIQAMREVASAWHINRMLVEPSDDRANREFPVVLGYSEKLRMSHHVDVADRIRMVFWFDS